MRKIATIIVLVFLSQSFFAQKFSSWEAGESPAHVPSPNIYEKVNRQFSAEAGAEEVRQAILEMKPMLLENAFDLLLKDAIESPGGFHYTYRQTWQGTPIYHAGIKANLNRGNRMVSLLNNLKAVAAPSQSFQATDSELEDHLYLAYFKDQADFSFEYERVWFPAATGLVPAFRVELAADGGLWELLLADTGMMEELLRRDLASYCRPMAPPPPTDTTGSGLVFNPDPLASSGNVYGGDYVDANDADNPILNAQRMQVVLRDITWNGTFFVLEGPYVKIVDAESPSIPPVVSADGNFNYLRSESGFEDVMCYYHIDTYQRYLQSLGFNNLSNFPITTDPHGLFGQDNSHFVPQGGNVRLGFGEGGVDDAEDADVIVHEYGHALSYSAAPGTNGGTERQGLDEGIGDYIAASYSKGLFYALWKNTFTWDGHNEYWPGRSASSGVLYPPSTSNIHQYGEIWASTLMEVHDQIGREASDKVFFESLYNNFLSMTFSDAARVVLDADSALYGGAHTLEYQDAFCRRGIFQGTLQGEACFVSAEESLLAEQNWDLFPNPAQSSVTIHLSDLARRKDLHYRLSNLLGQIVKSGEVQQKYTETSISDLESGLYLVELWQGDVRLGSKRLEIMR